LCPGCPGPEARDWDAGDVPSAACAETADLQSGDIAAGACAETPDRDSLDVSPSPGAEAADGETRDVAAAANAKAADHDALHVTTGADSKSTDTDAGEVLLCPDAKDSNACPLDALCTRHRNPHREPFHDALTHLIWRQHGHVDPFNELEIAVAEVETSTQYETRVADTKAGVTDREIEALGARYGGQHERGENEKA